MFFKGAIFRYTYNQNIVFSHSQLALCYDVPQQIDIDNFWTIKMLVFPPTINYGTFVLTLTYQKITTFK